MALGRPPKTIRPVLKHISLPEDLVANVELALFSQALGRVPLGAWQQLLEGLLREWLARIGPAHNVKAPAGEVHHLPFEILSSLPMPDKEPSK
jgi:hypothetical protein